MEPVVVVGFAATTMLVAAVAPVTVTAVPAEADTAPPIVRVFAASVTAGPVKARLPPTRIESDRSVPLSVVDTLPATVKLARPSRLETNSPKAPLLQLVSQARTTTERPARLAVLSRWRSEPFRNRFTTLPLVVV